MRRQRLILFLIIIFCVVGLSSTVLYYFKYRTIPEFIIPLLPEADLAKKGETVLVFAPHSDDEVLGAGGYIRKSIQNGANVKVILITNGDGHRFTSVEEFKKLYPKPEDYIQSGYLRQKESEKALAILGVKAEDIIFLGYPDHGIKELLESHWQTPYTSPYLKQSTSPYNNSYHPHVAYTGENLQQDIASILKTYQPKLIIGPHPQDVHPDHSASAFFIHRALEKTGLKIEFYSYLVHFPRFPYPKNSHKNRFLTPPARLFTLSSNWFKVSLDDETENLKERAVFEYRSQLKSPFLKGLMLGFVKQNELLSKADFSNFK
jgi:LmbE family N-acetylglucosaminyl deacetylase